MTTIIYDKTFNTVLTSADTSLSDFEDEINATVTDLKTLYSISECNVKIVCQYNNATYYFYYNGAYPFPLDGISNLVASGDVNIEIVYIYK